ncbi:MAG: hypothetical protein KGO05_12560 [Chloroflexota bacterium]|nr:hypothetical protein [Chloroflexota bacterium]
MATSASRALWQAGNAVGVPACSPEAPPDALASATGWMAWLIGWTRRHPRAPLAIAIALGLAVRIALLIRTHAMIDGDEALVGIQAQRILEGARPVYFYGQAYMGSLEAYLAAGVFAVFGGSAWTLRAIPIALSIPLVYLTWRLALALLPARAPTTPLLAGLAALLAAAPPLYDLVAGMRAWGGQIEVYVISLALLLASVELADRLRDCAAPWELTRRWAIWGLLAGLGFWVNPLISYALVACALWLTPPLLTRVFPGPWRRVAGRWPALWSPATGTDAFRPGAALAWLALFPGAALGGLPAWLYALANDGQNLLVFTQPTIAEKAAVVAFGGRFALGGVITREYLTCAAPRALAGGLPSEGAGWALALALVALALVGVGWLLWRRPALPLAPRLGLPLLYLGVVTAIFCLTTSAWAVTKGCYADQAGRYAVPLSLAAPLLLLGLLAVPQMAPRAWGAVRRWGGQVALALLLALVVAQSGAIFAASPTTTFQSPYFRYAPPQRMAPLLTWLRVHHIHDAWCNHWIGNIITFESGGDVVCADYYDQVLRGGVERPPGSLDQVGAAANPSFILAITDEQPLLARELDALGVPYSMTILRAEGVTIITPARKVNPASVFAGLGQDYGASANR